MPSHQCGICFQVQGNVKFYLVQFGDDAEYWKLIVAALWPAIAEGMLTVASGGGSGIEHSMKHKSLDSHPDMPLQPNRAERSGRKVTGMLKFWHASYAKNAAHVAAMHEYGVNENVWLCNLDADNLITPSWCLSVWKLINERKTIAGACIRCGGEIIGALTGRMLYRSCDFLALGGYDENGTPSGGQDVDIRTRMELLFYRNNDRGVPKTWPCPRVMNFDVCGPAQQLPTTGMPTQTTGNMIAVFQR